MNKTKKSTESFIAGKQFFIIFSSTVFAHRSVQNLQIKKCINRWYYKIYNIWVLDGCNINNNNNSKRPLENVVVTLVNVNEHSWDQRKKRRRQKTHARSINIPAEIRIKIYILLPIRFSDHPYLGIRRQWRFCVRLVV